MNFFRYLFCNQYAEISGRGGDGRKAQLNMIILSALLITLYIIMIVVLFGKLNPGYVNKILSLGFVNGKAAGRFLGLAFGLVAFFILKFFIGSKEWYDATVKQYDSLLPEEQKRAGKKGIRYFFIASIPVIAFIIQALISVF